MRGFSVPILLDAMLQYLVLLEVLCHLHGVGDLLERLREWGN